MTTSAESLQREDMLRERSQCSFSFEPMSCIYAGSKDARDHARWLFSLLQDYPGDVFRKAKEARPFQGRKERFQAGQQVALAYWTIRNREGLTKPDRDLLRLYVDEYLPVQVLESMFAPTIQNQSSEEQWREWGPSVLSGRWTGCYAQTELAHGSNLSRLRTTATLDRSTDEWVIHTPEPSAGKIWIGGAGCTATHGIVMAQMIMDGENFGLHPFLVPFRSLETHQTLPGVKIIDQGPKLGGGGAPAMDNGYICFDHKRIPRTNLLAKFQYVDKDGKYELRNKEAKVLTRGTMTLVRVGLVEIAAHHLSRATLIAIRYAVVRRQGSGKSKAALEPQILDYPSVQQRLFTALASSFALTFTGRHMRSIYNAMMDQLQHSGQSPLLPIVHGFSSILKACATNESLAGIERCRRNMGGHGYSLASGISGFEVNQPNAGLTYEGDNNMLLGGPAASFLVKMLHDKNAAASRPELAFLHNAEQRPDIKSLKGLLEIVGHRCQRLTKELSALRKGRGNGTPAHVAEHLDANLAMRASKAAGSYLILFAFVAYLNQLSDASSPARKQLGVAISNKELSALHNLAAFYAIEVCILSELGEYTEETGYLTSAQISELRVQSAQCMARIRPDALGLAEACDMHDDYLDSPLGSSEGNAYERMIEWMHKEPLNHCGEGEEAGRDKNGVVKGWKHGLGKLIAGDVVPFDESKEAARQQQRASKL